MIAAVSLAHCLLLATAVMAPFDAAQPPACWAIAPEASQLTVHVRSSGALSFALHDHHFVPQELSGRACFDPDQPADLEVEVIVPADSLVDRQPELSAEDRKTVEAQVRDPEVLDAAEYPTIRFEADRFDVTSRDGTRASGVLRGRLTLHGQTHELDVPVQAEWSRERLRVTGDVRFEQSRFGIEPYERYLGTVSVEDEVEVEFALDGVREK